MRSTENKLIHVALNVGMDQAPSEFLAPTGTLSSVLNCRVSGNGILEKRAGSTALSGTTAKSPTHSLTGNGTSTNIESPSFACQVQSAMFVGNTYGDAFSYSTIWQFQGRFSTCLPVRKRYGLAVDDVVVSGNGFGPFPPDIIVTSLGGYICVAAITRAGNLHFYIEDQNGVRIYYLEAVGPYDRARLVAQLDSSVVLLLQVGTALTATEIDIVNGVASAVAPVSVGTLSNSSASWDVSNYVVGSNVWMLVYQSGAALASVASFQANVVVQTATFAVTGLPPFSIWADPITNQAWIGFFDSPGVANNVNFTVYNIVGSGLSAFTLAKAITTLKTAAFLGPPMFGRYRGVVPNTTKKAFYCFQDWSSFGAGNNVVATWVGAAFGSATAPTTPVACWQIVPISKPDNYNRVWCMTQSRGSNQLLSRVMLLRFPDETLSAPPTIELSGPNFPAFQSSSFNPFTINPMWFSGTGLNATRSYAVLPNVLQQFYGAQAIFKFDVYEYTTAEQEPHRQSVSFGATTVIAGQPVEFWGQSVAQINNATTFGADAGALAAGASEIGFPHAPILFSVTPSNAGIGFGANGTRSWRVTFEWVDLYGRRHQSAPSVPVSSTSDAAHVSADLLISTTDITQRQAANIGLRVFLRIYRTVAGGTEYHECATTAVAFDQTDGLIAFNDSESDANIAQTGFLYTDGGVLDDTLAPSCRFMCKSEDRIWFGGLWDANIILCSKVIVPGEPIQCTDDFSHQVQLPAANTGLAYMDGNVVAFTVDAIYLVGGDGPNDQGAGSFPPPRCLTRSVGCCDYRSIVETNVGIMFQSNLGLYLLPRGFGPAQYIGAAIRSDMDALGDSTQDLGPVVLGAISHITRSNHIARFLVAAGSATPPTSATDIFTFDIDSSQWFHDTLVVGVGAIGAYDSSAVSGKKGALYAHSNLSSLVNTSPVAIESESEPADESGTLVITQFVETAWIHPFGLGGWGKVNCVLFIVESLGASQQLDVTVTTDENTDETASWVITGAQRNYRSLAINVRGCTSVQIQMRCATPAGAIGGFRFISCTLEVEPTDGIRLLSDAEKS